MSKKHPLVSIVIYNYNYGRYLRECFESALNQSHENIEILFSDNASTDDSWNIALAFSQQHPDKIFLARNHQNFGATANLKNCLSNVHGKYYVILCADDVLHKDYVKTAVSLLEAHTDTAVVMVHRHTIDDSSHITEEVPFYNQSCKIPPPLQSLVYMMASVNPSLTQMFYRTDYAAAIKTKEGASGHANRYFGARLLDFTLSCVYSMIYVKKPLVCQRVHPTNDSKNATDNLMQIIGPYFLNIEFCEIAKEHNHHQVSEKWQASVEKLAELSLRYASHALMNGNEQLAKRYFFLAQALHSDVTQHESFALLADYWQDISKQKAVLKTLKENNTSLSRSHSYDPPVGSVILDSI